MMTALDRIRARLARWREEIPKLVQPEPSVVRDREDLARLLAAVELADKVLKQYENYCVIEKRECAYSEQFDEFIEVWRAREARAEIERILQGEGNDK